MAKAAKGTPALESLTKAGVPYSVHTYEHDPRADSYGLEAAEKSGVEPARVFKTLMVTGAAGQYIGIVPVNRQLDLKAMASAVGEKSLTMTEPKVAERISGYVVGGISPLGQKKVLPTVIDESAQLYETVFVSGGRRGLEIELAPTDLAAELGADVASISR